MLVGATCESEAGELLELNRQRFHLAEIKPLHSSLGNRARLSKNKLKIELLYDPAILLLDISKFLISADTSL